MGQKGQSLVELSVSFVFLMLLLVGAVEFGIIFFQFVQLRDAAQEGALYGSYCQDNSQIEYRIIDSSNSLIDLNDANISIQYIDKATEQVKDVSLLQEGDGVRVKISYNHEIFVPFLPAIIGDYITLNGEVVDTVLKVDC